MQRSGLQRGLIAIGLILVSGSAWGAAANVACVYGTQSKILRWAVTADTDAEIAAVAPGAGESLVLIPASNPPYDAACDAAILAATGVMPPDGRAAVLAAADASGNQAVVDVVVADPNIDDPARLQNPGVALMASDVPMKIGDRWNPATAQFERLFSIAAPVTRVVVQQAWLSVVNPISPVAGDILWGSAVPIGTALPSQTVVTAPVTTP